MSVTPVLLTSGVDETDASSYTTASVSPSNTGPLLLFVNITGVNATFDTVSGLGVTWTSLAEVAWSTIGTPTKRARVYKGIGTASAGQVTITTTGTATGCMWTLLELTNADESTLTVATAVTDSATNPFSVPSSPISAQDVFISAVFKGGQALPTQEAGHTMLASGSSAAPPGAYGVAWAQNDTQASWSVGTVAAAGLAVTAAEMAGGATLNIQALEVATDESDASSYLTGSVSPSQDPVLLFATVTGGGRRITGVSGLGLEWTLVAEQSWYTSDSPARHSVCYVGLGDAVPGQVTISVDGTATSCGWALLSLQNADPTAPIAQVGSAYSDVAVSSLDVPAAAFDAYSDAAIVSYLAKNGQTAATPETGHTSLGSSSSASPGWSQAAAWHTSDTQATWTFSSVIAAGLAVVVRLAGTAPPPGASGPYTFSSVIWGAGFQNCGAVVGSAVLSGADVAGVYRSTDNGSTWKPTYGESAFDQRNVASLAASPNVAGRVWSIRSSTQGGKLQVMRSNDSGATWTLVATLAGKGVQGGGDAHPRQTGRLIVEQQGAAANLIIGTSDGIYLSTDTGVTWSQRALAGRAVTSVIADPNDANAVYVAADSDGSSPGVYRVANAFSGTPTVTTLSSTLTDAQELLALSVGGATRLYVAAGSGGVWEYSGGSWTDRSSGLPTGVRWCSIDGYYTGTAVRLIVGCSGASGTSGAVWRSTDGGATWSGIFQAANLNYNVNGDPSLGTWWFLNYSSGQHNGVAAMLVIDPTNTSRAWRFGRSGVWRTNNLWDASPSWHPVVRGLGVTIEWNPAVHPTSPQRVAIGDTDWECLTTADAYANGQAVRNNPAGMANGYALYCEPSGPKAGRLWLAVGDRDTNTQGGVWYSDDWWLGSSATWTSTNWGITQRAMGIVAFRDGAAKEVVVAYADGVGIRRRYDGGAWSTVQSIAVSPTNKTVTFAIDPPYVWAYVPESGLWRSTDHGASWSLIWAQTTSGRSRGYVVRDPWDPDVVWVSRSQGLWRISGARGTISPQQVTVSGLDDPGPMAAHPTYGLVVANLAPSGTKLMRTRDGSAWEDIADDVYRGAALWAHGMAWGSDGTLWVSTDGRGSLKGTTTQAPPLVILTESLPDGIVGDAYSATLEASGGTTPYSWSVVSGSVPGLSLSSAGVLSGTPTTMGTYSLTVRVTDAADATADRTYAITIASQPTAGGLQYGRTYYVRIVAKDVDGAAPASAAVPGQLSQLTEVDIQADSITASHIRTGAIKTRHLAAGSITADKLASQLIATTQIILSQTGAVLTEDEVPVIRATGLSRVRAVKTTNQSIANATDTTVTIGSGDLQADTDGYLVSNSFKVPFDGQYLLVAGVRWAANSTGRRRLWAQLSTDGGSTWTDIRQTGAADDRLPTPTSPTAQSFATVLSLTAGNRIRLRVFQDSGGALSLTDANANVTFLGPA